MSKLVSLALAAEARGRAHDLLDQARRQTERLRADLEQQARELVDQEQRDAIARTRPGEQIPLAGFHAMRYVENARRLQRRR